MSHTLLLADDSVTIQRVIELTFADEDVDVVAVSDGDEAIAVLDRTPPDIVLADVGMPGRNGYEVAQHIKETPRLAHIPVVLLTGAFEPIDQAKAAAAGCDGVLAKPFEPQLVIGRVRELLAKPKQAASIDTPSAPPAWEPPVESPGPTGMATPNPGEAGDYFDRLDQAFANLSGGPADAGRPGASGQGATALDWFASQPPADLVQSKPASVLPDRWDAPPVTPAPAPPLALSFCSPPASPFDPSPSSGSSPTWPSSDYAQARPAPLPTLPPLVDAFAALLAAEQASPSPVTAPTWPSLPQPPPASTVVGEDVIEQVTRRVIDRLTDRVVREAVEEKVSAIAERLIREEIQRIKASIK